MSEKAQEFNGWAVIEIFGHQKYAGLVETVYYGTACLFRIDIPGLPERERTTKFTQYIDGKRIPAGSVVKSEATEPATKMFGVSSVFSITPCTEEAVLVALENMMPRPVHVMSVPPERLQISAADDEAEEGGDEQEIDESSFMRP